MINTLLKIGGAIMSAFGMTKKNQDEKGKMIYMKRALFIALFILAIWAMVEPESLAMRLEHAAEVLPAWLKAAMASMFAGVIL